ncbi:mannose-6-phosphate isomerase, class I [Paecilomyces variotii]|uniref:Mannose-6-phosphate isomerase n=1 Tax=Byssochlamys spectabilis TaxID=264951 RepID=A0A443I2Y0_BYSSP|nr:mannose-6-phosphate isomerase, class I [Paecilomyces variotii]KAJ9260003.1 hypothetical protein DTO207G8_700 [Paecilomyces variotii]KAJ9267390.1 hypothetical protein DTO195F2_623 [Paecilomyces variotii]KAJ9360939.1 hypothetical protein DTO280E4_4150 [Paecilomyces variotii]KAJ9390665.1 hypothetical protein DTO063F5_1615 [Paecilomyces variotii]RWQ98371.1 mannose-6-phosphate isomerase, class I [Paecilomyces variotii]
MAESVIPLKCECKHDPWGKKGSDSMAARFWAKTPLTGGKIDETKPYSEMWMGTYPSTPSYVLSSGEQLESYLKNHPELLGKNAVDKWGTDLPFLPKILSMCKALPLQIHPDKALAEKLHSREPNKFTDPNHKPEIAIALGKFELFAGFKPLADIQALFRLKPLEHFVPNNQQNFTDETLRQVCRNLLLAEDNVVQKTIEDLKKLPESAFSSKDTGIPAMLDRLQQQYTEFDNGNLVAVLLMNFLTLDKGDAVYIPADGIHAYLSGDIMECMARSDNVLNTGFCPRPERDSVDVFTQALTFHPHDPKSVILPSSPSLKSECGKTREYSPPISEFNVLATCLKKGEKENIKAIMGPSVQVVTKGSGRLTTQAKTVPFKEGTVLFIGQDTPVGLVAEEDLELYRAYAE